MRVISIVQMNSGSVVRLVRPLHQPIQTNESLWRHRETIQLLIEEESLQIQPFQTSYGLSTEAISSFLHHRNTKLSFLFIFLHVGSYFFRMAVSPFMLQLFWCTTLKHIQQLKHISVAKSGSGRPETEAAYGLVKNINVKFY